MNKLTSLSKKNLLLLLLIKTATLSAKMFIHRNITPKRQAYFALPQAHKPITIIVHGTRLPAPVLLIPGLKEQVLTPPRLHKAKDLGNFYFYARLAATLSASDPEQFPFENMYLFGWSGILSFAERQRAGKELYNALTELYRARTLVNESALSLPPITIITISHGGNVALCSAQEAHLQSDIRTLVDKLVMLASPVQKATENYSKSPIFKHIFHLFGPRDMIQILDPQGLYKRTKILNPKQSSFFSQRTFKNPPSNMIQTALTRYGYSLSHIDFIASHFTKQLPKILSALEDPDILKKIPVNAQGIYRLDYRRFFEKLR